MRHFALLVPTFLLILRIQTTQAYVGRPPGPIVPGVRSSALQSLIAPKNANTTPFRKKSADKAFALPEERVGTVPDQTLGPENRNTG